MKENSLKSVTLRRQRDPCLGGLVPFSTVDWPDHLCATLFVSGCPWRCHYCHNPHLQPRESGLVWADTLRFLESRRNLLDGVVISGGEPLMDPELPRLVEQLRNLGFEVGLHTAGIYPDRLEQILPHLSWVGLDIKTLPERYDDLTARQSSWAPVACCLNLLREWNGSFECRTTWSEAWLSQEQLVELARMLLNLNVDAYAIQRYRHAPDQEPADMLSPEIESELRSMFKQFSYR